jgi:O-antigen/teichoic acid export membrane protein
VTEDGVALIGEGTDGLAGRMTFGRLAGRVKSWLGDGSDRMVTQRLAGNAFLIRVASAGIAYLTQIALARWLGRHEYGIYVYVWTWMLLIAALAPIGVAYSAQRFIPQYRAVGDDARLRGFLDGSRMLCFAFGTICAAVGAAITLGFGDRIGPHYTTAFLIALAMLPIFTLGEVQDTISRSFNWINLALVPAYVFQPLIIMLGMTALYLLGRPLTATSALTAAVAGFWLVISVQFVLLQRRLGANVARGPHIYEFGVWLKTAAPIFLVDSFFYLLTFCDILILQLFVEPAQVGTYYAVTKTLALVNFIYFAVAAATGHRFSEYHVNGEREKLAAIVRDAVRWTFWPSLAVACVLLALGKPILMLFGSEFTDGYPLMFVLAIGLIARASVGPAERLLGMTGQQGICAAVYAIAFATNIALCFALIPRYGLAGAAIATMTAIVLEACLLALFVKLRLGLDVFVFSPRRAEH